MENILLVENIDCSDNTCTYISLFDDIEMINPIMMTIFRKNIDDYTDILRIVCVQLKFISHFKWNILVLFLNLFYILMKVKVPDTCYV